MSRFRELSLVVFGAVALAAMPASAGDIDAGANVFKKCKACHAVGEGAKNKVGPQLNNLIGRVAGSLEDYKYSKAMTEAGEEGLVWNHETLTSYLAKPRAFVKKTRMSFAGLRKDDDIENVITYLESFSSSEQGAAESQDAPSDMASSDMGADEKKTEPDSSPAEHPMSYDGLGRPATQAEIAAWDIDIRPDGMGLPEGSGTVAHGETIFDEQCAVCHGDFGEAVGRWPVLAGGFGTLKDNRPVKTVGSYWPYLSTVYDYVRRAMPFGNARSLSDDDVYALTAYVLYLNDLVDDETFELSKDNFTSIEMPNTPNFIPDDRLSEPHYAKSFVPCMTDCAAEPAKITMHAAVLDVTPESGDDDAPAGEID